MADQFVWWHGGDYTVLGGSRKGVERRKLNERRGSIANGIFAVNVLDRRQAVERRQIRDRRIEEGVSSTGWLADLMSSISLGVFLLTIGIIFLVLGITMFPAISKALGLLLTTGGAFVILIHVHKSPKN
jgi:hypothetical protein